MVLIGYIDPTFNNLLRSFLTFNAYFEFIMFFFA
jgi:hypothetical protein